MTDKDWNAGFTKCMGVRLAGDLIDDEDERGDPIMGDTLLLLLNAHYEPVPFTLPLTKVGQRWELLIDTAEEVGTPTAFQGQDKYPLKDRSLAILRTHEVETPKTEPASTQGDVARPSVAVPPPAR
jgi:glycogen operon protein